MYFKKIILAILFFSFIQPLWAARFDLTSTGFLQDETFPKVYTCEGKDAPPQLSWINPPEKTVSFALFLTDPDAPTGTWYHWVVYNIPSTVDQLKEYGERFPAEAKVGKNSWDRAVYNGPCPPKGQLHHYIFTLYALDSTLNLPAGRPAGDVLEAIKKHIIQSISLTGVYQKDL